MPKNKGKGGKNRRRGKNENDNEKRELTFKEEGQEYAQVVKMLGYVNNRYIPGARVRDKIAGHFSRGPPASRQDAAGDVLVLTTLLETAAWRRNASTAPADSATSAASFARRSGSTRATSSCCRCVTTRTTRVT